jgi:hypothetical protein
MNSGTLGQFHVSANSGHQFLAHLVDFWLAPTLKATFSQWIDIANSLDAEQRRAVEEALAPCQTNGDSLT